MIRLPIKKVKVTTSVSNGERKQRLAPTLQGMHDVHPIPLHPSDRSIYPIQTDPDDTCPILSRT